jgi:hypothetical protein
VEIVVARHRLDQVPLLLDRRELRVALVHDQVEQRIANPLIRDLPDALPFRAPRKVAELDLGRMQIPELRLEAVVLHDALVEADVLAPDLEQVGPVVEGRNARHGGSCGNSRP